MSRLVAPLQTFLTRLDSHWLAFTCLAFLYACRSGAGRIIPLDQRRRAAVPQHPHGLKRVHRGLKGVSTCPEGLPEKSQRGLKGFPSPLSPPSKKGHLSSPGPPGSPSSPSPMSPRILSLPGAQISQEPPSPSRPLILTRLDFSTCLDFSLHVATPFDSSRLAPIRHNSSPLALSPPPFPPGAKSWHAIYVLRARESGENFLLFVGLDYITQLTVQPAAPAEKQPTISWVVYRRDHFRCSCAIGSNAAECRSQIHHRYNNV